MKVIEPGHIYKLDHLDGSNKQIITFVNREEGLGKDKRRNGSRFKYEDIWNIYSIDVDYIEYRRGSTK